MLIERLRWPAGEAIARGIFLGPEAERRELVAIGVMVPNKSDLVWRELHNAAVHPDREFEVLDSDMRRVVHELMEAHGSQARVHVLWHCHYVHNEPSGTDISSFPEWLASVGVVYHAPTGTSHAYDSGGIISPL